MAKPRKPTVIDMFAGAGLLSHAFVREGFNVIEAYEKDPRAAETYARNVGRHVRIADIGHVPCDGRCDALIAGPPCQGFSTLGKRDLNDPRNFLSVYVADWARLLQPRVIVIENVAAFLKAPVWKYLADRFERMGYSVTAQVIDAVDFGSPQKRLRSFMIASRIGDPVIRRIVRGYPKNVREAWCGLPERPNQTNWHYAPAPSPLALARMRVIPQGGDKRDVMRRAPHLAPPSWWKVRGDVTDVWGRMAWDKPSNTIRTAFINPSKGRYIHPEQNRVISLREGARLQGIPDGWNFAGVPYQISRQIGNSVPLPLGRAVARAVFELF
jgi:DNA (cytosine-5)-methyltransferase 1